ncbi:MAG: N-6 DNA methylase [Defluviitaleaceae bacterium]|nr:N-6 DNA methylase [Defluviitaleaceae bacterium]
MIESSESPEFYAYETIGFSEADVKFKLLESKERDERATAGISGGYRKTHGVIFYLDSPEDTEYSVYEFRYDIGDYPPERSGLYNHITNFWQTEQELRGNGEYTGYTAVDAENIQKMLAILKDYAHDVQESELEVPSIEPLQEQASTPEPAPSTPEPLSGPPAVFFADWKKARHDIDPVQPDTEIDHAPQSGDPVESSKAAPIVSTVSINNLFEVEAKRNNFRITDERLGEGGPKTKYGYNVAAIQTLQEIESENRLATPVEQETLSRYVGWGSIPQAFDPDNAEWSKEYSKLSGLLSPDEYENARASTLNAHYTSPTIINTMYETLERLGFKDGKLLEPSMGVGNFFGLLPDTMKDVRLHGVELDSITGRIAKQLYQDADIRVTGYENTDMPDASFDVAIGNVPFGAYTVVDRKYQNLFVHDYFFVKTLDQVRSGGIIAFITSKGTMDKAKADVRKYIAQRAELLGAVRLPNNAFLKNAGTEVTSDIIFLQKRERKIDIEPDWVHLGQTEDGIPINSYFVDNPHMILGTMAYGNKLYGNKKDTTCNPIEGVDLSEQLKDALSHVSGRITEHEMYVDLDVEKREYIPADPSVRNHSYTIVDGDVYFRENSRMYRADISGAASDRTKGMIELRNCLNKVIDSQMNGDSDYELSKLQSELNRLYDNFKSKHGAISARTNANAFAGDSSYHLLASLEVVDEHGKVKGKSDIFSKRTIKQKAAITSVDTSSEALAVSISEKARVDIGFMRKLTGLEEEKIIADLQGVIFKIPHTERYAPADEYLSGNVRKKLVEAREAVEGDSEYAVNVTALEKVQPKDLDASEIAVRLGSTWIDKSYIQEFVLDTLKPSPALRRELDIDYSGLTGDWRVNGKGSVTIMDVLARTAFGTDRINAFEILESTLNLRDVRIYDTITKGNKEIRAVNKAETILAQQRQQALKDAFSEWIFKDPTRRNELVKLYNERFNSVRPREYDGSHLELAGINPRIEMRPHQLNAIAHAIYGGNTLLAHEVGAGKTFEMIAIAMESKRLGLCTKSLMAVPNHLTVWFIKVRH